ncbi:MAG: peptidylprolyl isomerase [Saprospiraceae bacterium]|nr:peptidylprolyl isomerase [Saprospiraceae bacterium]
MRKSTFYALLLLASGLTNCVPPSNEQFTDVNIDLKDPVFQQIHELQDRQNLDSLYTFFTNENPNYRYLAAVAFGSIRKAETIDQLATLLQDEVPEVRAAAAYALGQTNDAKAEPLLIEAFDGTDTAGIYRKSNRAILEAIGRCGTAESLKFLSTITTYQPKDTALLEGQAYGIYRFGLRDIVAPEGTERMISLAGNSVYPESVRYIAANYFARVRNIEIDSIQSIPLIQIIGTEANPDIRMALAIGLGKVKTATAQDALLQLYQKESDYRVKCNILRALSNFPYDKVQATVIQALKDPQIHVAQRAAQFFVESGIPEDATVYWRLAKDSAAWQVSIELYAAALRHLPPNFESYRNGINYELRRRFAQATSPYHKAATLRALSEWGWNFRFIYREGMAAKQLAVRTASADALATLCQNAAFRRNFGSSAAVEKELAFMFTQMIQTGDPGLISVAAGALRIPDRNFKAHIDSLNILENALTKLELPREIETYNDLKRTIEFLQGKTDFQAQKLDYNHPIDWEVIKNLSPEPKALLRTNRGDITIRLLPEIAPGSVVNFVQLAKDGFYDGKTFHRVVANFVVQGGCPRGDGYGSLDYSIRSELPPIYYDREGYVGMASAGNHTEGTQFFITHSPTPHLDGNYTIFGRVVEGMDIVHLIRIGDVINKVLIQ